MWLWFKNEKLKMCLASKGAWEHTHLEGMEVFRPIYGFHMHCLKSFLKDCPQANQSIHKQSIIFYDMQYLSANETYTCLKECLRVSV